MRRSAWLLSIGLLSACGDARTPPDRSGPPPGGVRTEAAAESGGGPPAAPPAGFVPTAAPTNTPGAATPPGGAETPLAVPDDAVRIVPGQRVGPLRPDTSADALAQTLGPPRWTEIGVGEGEVRPGAVFAEGTDRALAVVWHDAAHTRPAFADIDGAAYRTAEGIGVGARLSDIVRVVGPVSILGWEWDYAGAVVLTGTAWDAPTVHLLILATPDPSDDPARRAAWERTVGDSEFRSDSEDIRLLDPVVRSMRIVFDG